MARTQLGLYQKKITGVGGGDGGQQARYFSMDGWCRHFSNYMGHLCLTKSDFMGGGSRSINNSVGGCSCIRCMYITSQKRREKFY